MGHWYQIARTEAAKVAPSLTDDQLTDRIQQADAIVATSPVGRKRYTIAYGARDAFIAERDARITLMPGHPDATRPHPA